MFTINFRVVLTLPKVFYLLINILTNQTASYIYKWNERNTTFESEILVFVNNLKAILQGFADTWSRALFTTELKRVVLSARL